MHFEEVNSAEDLLPRQGDDFRRLMAPAEDDPLLGLINSQLSLKKPELLKHSLLAINRSTSGARRNGMDEAAAITTRSDDRRARVLTDGLATRFVAVHR